jgi:hypothetical protein
MGLDNESKWKVILNGQSIHQNGQILEFEYRLSGKNDEADKIWQENRRLSAELDILIGQAIDDWLEDAGNTLKRVEKASSLLQSAIDEIETAVNRTETIIKAVGYFDNAIDIFNKCLKKI